MNLLKYLQCIRLIAIFPFKEFSDDDTPLRNHRQAEGLKANDLDALASSLLGINKDVIKDRIRKKRNVETTAHRIPGSFNDEFLTALVDQLNSTGITDFILHCTILYFYLLLL